MLRCTRLALLLSTVAFITIANVRDAKAGCTPGPTAGGDIIVCDAATPPNPSGPFNFLGGDDKVTVNSGTYGAFTFPSGTNALIFGLGGGAPVLNGTVLFGAGADRMEVHSGTITGNVDQGSGIDTFIMTGGTIIGNLEQSGGFDIFLMSGGTITGAFIEGDDITITGGSIGSVNMNIGNNIFRMSGGTVVGDVIGFGNDDTFILSGTAFIGGNVDLGNGDNSFTVTGGQIVGNVTAGPGTAITPGNDKFTWDGGGTIGGAISLGAGNDVALLRNLTSAHLTNTLLDGGSGTDQLTFDNVVSAGIDRYKNWETIIVTNGSQLTLDGNLVLGDGGSVPPITPMVVPPTNTGALSIDATSTLFAGGGVNPSILPFTAGNLVTVTNAGTIDLTNGGSNVTDTFTVVGHYVGAGGFVNLNTVLSTDGSPSDRLIIDSGTATGSSLLRIVNAGGSGAMTAGNGILVVDTINGATTLPSSFGLAVPVAAGPYAYTLHRSSVDASNAEAWYLRSTIDCALDPGSAACVAAATPAATAPNYRPETSLYAALPALTLLYGRTLLDTLHERMGEEGSRHTGQWGRVTVLHGNRDGDALGIFGSGPKYAYDFAAFQAGLDLYRTSAPNGSRTRAGAYVALGSGRGDVTHFDATTAGHNSFTAMTAGAYWTHFGPTGWYLDGVLQGTWYDVRGASTYLSALETEGAGLAASLEGGLPLRIGGGWVVEPQVQAVFQNIDLHDGNDGAAAVQFRDVQSLAGRVGVRIAHTWSPAGTGNAGQVTVWLRPNLWHEFLGDPVTSFSSDTGPIPFSADFSGGWAELNTGITAQLTGNVALFANASYQRGLDGDSTAYNGKLGFRIAW